MEKAILEKLEWNLTVATPYVFLVRFIKATVPSDKKVLIIFERVHRFAADKKYILNGWC